MASKQDNHKQADLPVIARRRRIIGPRHGLALALFWALSGSTMSWLLVPPAQAQAQPEGYPRGYVRYPGTADSARRGPATNAAVSSGQSVPPSSPQPPAIPSISAEDAAAAMTRGDYAIAYCHYHPLARQGNAEAQYNLGWMYANGYGLAKDETKALIWWRKAARQNHSDAVVAVAMAYLHGDGTKKDKGEALKWLVEAAEHGVEDAMEIILTLVAQNTPEAMAVMARLIREDSALLQQRYRIKVPRANVRKGPDKSHALITTLKEGDPLVGLGAEGNWVRVGLPGDGQVGWIYKTLLESVGER
ncbi:MAG: SH3 domain-containing protein [Gammaproteobacteria bacterium]